jgi:hypothetical protein
MHANNKRFQAALDSFRKKILHALTAERKEETFLYWSILPTARESLLETCFIAKDTGKVRTSVMV